MRFIKTFCLLLTIALSMSASLATQAAGNALTNALSNNAQSVSLQGDVDEAVNARIVANRTAATPQSNYEIGIEIRHPGGWNTYWKNPGQSGHPIEIEWILPRGWNVQSLGWPLPEQHKTGNLVTYNYSGTILLPFKLDVPWGTPYGTSATIRAKVSWLACKTTCIPGSAELKFQIPIRVSSEPSPSYSFFEKTKRFIPELVDDAPITATLEGNQLRFDFPDNAGYIKRKVEFFPTQQKIIDLSKPSKIERANEKTSLYLSAHPDFVKNPETITGIFVADKDSQQNSWAIETTLPVHVIAVAPTPTNPLERQTSKFQLQTPKLQQTPSDSNIGVLGLAFLGGLLLNLMPCVFPVLSLKLLHLIDTSRRKGSLILHGFSFSIGVILSMAMLAGLLFFFKSIGLSVGWGFQLQSPFVVAFLSILFFSIGLNLFGLFEFTAATHLTDTRALRDLPKDGPLGSFFTGILTVIVASPCTAPFMGVALGYALTQTYRSALPVFLVLGLGIAFPWFVLTVIPFWIKWLPKPGKWMVTLKKVLAIPMFIATLWLLWVYSHQVNFYGIITLVLATGLSALCLWSYGRTQYGRDTSKTMLVMAAIGTILAMALIGMNFFNEAKQTNYGKWKVWSPESVLQSVYDDHPVIVDYTATWCITCQYNKTVALRTKKTEQTLQRLGYHRYVADWTNRDERISRSLATFARPGVPLYLLYNTKGEITVLPELLSESLLIDALKKNAKK